MEGEHGRNRDVTDRYRTPFKRCISPATGSLENWQSIPWKSCAWPLPNIFLAKYSQLYPVTSQMFGVCFLSSLRHHDALFGDQPIYLACVARSSSWPSNSTSDLTLSSTCSTDLSVLEEFPDDVPVVISLYDLLEALASRNSSCRPHLVLSSDIQPHLRGVPPVYASIALSPSTFPATSTSGS